MARRPQLSYGWRRLASVVPQWIAAAARMLRACRFRRPERQQSAPSAPSAPPAAAAAEPDGSRALGCERCDGLQLRWNGLQLRQEVCRSHVRDMQAKLAAYQNLFEQSPHLQAELDAQGSILTLNRNGAELLGYSVDEVLGRHYSELFASCGGAEPCALREMPVSGTRILRHRQGRQIPVRESLVRNPSTDVPRYFWFCEDIGEALAEREALLFRANHDALTGLLNRAAFEELWHQTLAAAPAFEHPPILLYLDLDHFKQVNDSCGHLAGDRVLKQVTQLMSDQVGDEPVMARLGGDEFVILLSNCSLFVGERMARNLCKAVSDAVFYYDQHEFRVGVSIGMVHLEDLNTRLEQALLWADSACYQAKHRGRAQVWLHRSAEGEAASSDKPVRRSPMVG